jgi:hypothetical protein
MDLTKSDRIRDALLLGDERKAVSIAATFFDRSDKTMLYKQAQSAANNPAFYRQIGKDPDAILYSAVAELRLRFL